MPTPPAQSGLIPISQAIHKYFELSLYLLVLTGFGALASTGGLDTVTLILAGAALAVRGYLLAKQRRIVIPSRWTTPLTTGYFLFYAADCLLFSRSFLAATVHLVLFAVVIRSFSLRRERDYVTLAILAFLMVLASAVLTVDSVFLFFFAIFMLTAVATFILMEMRRSAKNARFQAKHSHDAQEHRHLAFSLARVTPILALAILLGAAVVFFVLPRMSTGYLSGYSFGTDFSTGFSDRVQLGRIGQIQQSDAVVMHIQIDGDRQGQYALHWRGVALAHFDGKAWSNPQQRVLLQRDPEGGFSIPLFSEGLNQVVLRQSSTLLGRPDRLIHYRILMEPIGTNVFFLAPWARRVSGPYRSLEIDMGGAVSDLDSRQAPAIYEAESDIAAPAPHLLREVSDGFLAYAQPYLQLPSLDPRIASLAAQVAASATNNYDKASAIERYLMSHYAYSLQLPRTEPADPLAEFLFVRKQGHCEYFASAMAVMLRTLRIPSRVVNGFRSDEFNDVTDNYVVRAKDAHAWVEAYFPGYGWVTFDPTPGGAVASPQGWERAMLYLDAASSFWREWVVSYDASHQSVLGQTVLSRTRSSLERTRMWARLRYHHLLDLARRSERDAEHTSWRGIALGIFVALVILILVNSGRLIRWFRTRSLRKNPARAPQQAAAMWYEKMLKSLAHLGIEKSPAQTPRELVGGIEDSSLREPASRFTQAYESARFGGSPADAEKLPELYEEVVRVGRK